MITIRLLMNGESSMMSPVSGLRRGAPGCSVSAAITATTATTARPAQRRPLASSAGSTCWPSSRASSSSSARLRSHAEPGLDDARGDEGDHHREKERAADTEVEVRHEVDPRVRVDQGGRLVGDVGDHRVGRNDQDVHAEGGADGAEAGGDPGDRRRRAATRARAGPRAARPVPPRRTGRCACRTRACAPRASRWPSRAAPSSASASPGGSSPCRR
jgi:hypothetical protein